MDRLWQKLNSIRAQMSISDYKDIILQLFLYKYLEDNESFNHFIEKEYSLVSMVNKIKEENFLITDLEEAFMSLELSVQGTYAEKILTDIFELPYGSERYVDIIKQSLEIILVEKVDFDTVEYFIHQFALSGGRLEGEFTSSREACNIVAAILSYDGVAGNIADQSCGSASMILSVGKTNKELHYSLQDVNKSAIRTAKIQMIIKGIPFDKWDIVHADTLQHDGFANEKYDVQVSFPPIALRKSFPSEVDVRFINYPRTTVCELYFLENMIYHMTENGKAAFVCMMQVLFSSACEGVRKKLLDANLVDAVIKLPSNCLYGTTIPVYIVILKKNRSKKDIVFIDSGSFFVRDRLRNTISQDNIDRIVNIYKNRQNINDICYSANVNEIADNSYSLLPEKYLIHRKIEKLLKNDSLVELSTVVDILKPRPVDGTGRCGSRKAYKYPFDYDGVVNGEITSVILMKGDIIINKSLMADMYVVDEELKETVYATKDDIIIRPLNIQSEYLYYFFNSEIGRLIIEMECPTSCGMKRATVASLESIKIPIPKKSADEYRRIFEIENHLKIDMEAFNMLLSKKDKYLDESVEDILNRELAEKVKICKKDIIASYIADDIRELNACYKVKAYKAAIILAGSILEAVLIDWLTEIEGINYFNTNYMVRDKKTGKTKRADLIDYIDAIAEIEKPAWMEEAEKAHAIREKRNLVHAKLVIKSENINEHTCRMVISYLKDVLRTRGLDS